MLSAPWLQSVLDRSESLSLDDPTDRRTLTDRILTSAIRVIREAGGTDNTTRTILNAIERT